MSDNKKEVKTKRFSLSKDEREKVQNIHSVMGIMALQREGLQHSLMLELARARERLSIRDNEAPEGYIRNVDFDPQSYELIVRDIPKPPEPAEKPDNPKVN
jgi:hypothetical protein